uniref:Transposase n=1 Tax=Ascaris lumbricoides TaxID=6252 RepID=A0A0M3IUM9_ASCLU
MGLPIQLPQRRNRASYGGDAMRLVALAGIVECLRALCSIEELVDYLHSTRGSALFRPLITFVARLSTTKMSSLASSRG